MKFPTSARTAAIARRAPNTSYAGKSAKRVFALDDPRIGEDVIKKVHLTTVNRF
jgi:hypothetical protein